MKLQEYAVYKGDEFLFIGTIQEIATEFNVKKDTARFWTSLANKRRAVRRRGESKRKIAIKIEDEGDD